MVVEELNEGARRELQHPVRRRAPNRTTHRNEIVLEKIPSVTATCDIIADGHGGPLRIRQRGHRLSIEAIDLQEHSPITRPKQIAPLSEQVVQAGAREL